MVKIISEILEVFAANNLFAEGVELIGSWCFKLYQKHLGAQEFPLATQDIDFLIPSPFHGREHPDFIKQIEQLGFNVDFKRDGSLFLWNAELKIEFITSLKSRGSDSTIKIKKLGLNAIPLRYVSLLLDRPITVVENDIEVLVPNPTNFCLHKLIIASKRRKIDKSLKDLQQAICTSVIVDSREIKRLFKSLPKKWRAAVMRMLEKAKKELPLLYEEINRLEFTLQSDDKLIK